jgi:sporulation protein YlmC with PRC-barrel domain
MTTKTFSDSPMRQRRWFVPCRCGCSLTLAICIAAGLTVAACSMQGAEKEPTQSTTIAQDTQPRLDLALPFDAQRLGLLKPTSALLGKKVIDPKGKTVGKLQDFILDLSSGQVLAALVSSSGKTPLTPVPARSFEAVRRDKAELNAAKKLFENAPRFPLARAAGPWEAQSLADSFLFFSQPAPLAVPAGFCCAAALLGQPLLSEAGETLGQVQELALDLPGGRAVYLVIQPAEGLDPLGDLYLVPPASAQLGTSGQTLTLKASLAHFLAGHHFPKEYPTDIVFPDVASAVYQHYGLLPDATAKPAAVPVPAALPVSLQGTGAPAQSTLDSTSDQPAIDSTLAAFDFITGLR